MRWLTLAAVLVGLAACTVPPDPLEIRSAPADFTIDATVQGPAAEGLRRARRPGRYIVEPDGVLRAGVGEGVTVDYYPPRTRQLTREQVERLWRLVRDSALIAPDNPDRARPGLPFPKVQLRPTALIAITYAGETEHYRVILDGGSPSANAAERLIDHLAELAWLEP